MMELACCVLGIVGSILNIRKSRWGFAVWMVGNAMWVAYGFTTGQIWFAGQYIFFFGLSAWGFVEWTRGVAR